LDVLERRRLKISSHLRRKVTGGQKTSGEKFRRTGNQIYRGLVMFVLLVFLVLVTPVPVLALLFVLQTVVIHVGFVPAFQPPAVHSIFAIIPVVIVVMVGIVDPVAVTIPVMIIVVLYGDYRLGIRQRSRQRRCQQNETKIPKSSVHSFLPFVKSEFEVCAKATS
jgi:Flp pilus assembly protein TadB